MRLARDLQLRLRTALVVLLALLSGATDAIGFFALGGAFTSVMTGNLVLLGLSAGQGDVSLLEHVGAAVAGYVVGAAAGTRLAGTHRPDDRVWPRAVTRALLAETAAFCVYAAGWWASDSHPTDPLRIGLLAVNAVALGIQSATMLRFGITGLTTTNFTGALTTIVSRLAWRQRLRGDEAGRPAAIIGLFVGAVIGGVLVKLAPVGAPLVQLVALAIVLGTAALALHRTSDPRPVAAEPSGG